MYIAVINGENTMYILYETTFYKVCLCCCTVTKLPILLCYEFASIFALYIDATKYIFMEYVAVKYIKSLLIAFIPSYMY